MAWIATPAEASMAEKADFFSVEYLPGKDSWKDQIKQGGIMVKDTSRKP